MKDWQGKRVLILGAARQGQALTRWLVRKGVQVTLSDIRSEEELKSVRQSLADLSINWELGSHPLDLLENCDMICISGGVPLSIPIIIEAQTRGIPLSNDTQIFLENAPCNTIGITGSAGKSTTTALVGKMAERSFHKTPRKAWVGGNIGDPLINHVDEMNPDDLAILEISSFQLDQMCISPNVAAILNLTPNHLDRHGTMEAYSAAKARILEFQNENDIAILGRDDPGSWNLREQVKGRLLSFGLSDLTIDNDGTYVNNDLYNLRDGNVYIPLPIQNAIHLRGDHNRLNILAAITIGHAAGLNLDAMLEAIDHFQGMPHRLEFVRELHGVKWYNDSIATAPERSMAAIHSFEEPIILLLGGKDKDLPWEELARLVHKRVDHVVVFGQAAEKILDAIKNSRIKGKHPLSIQRCTNVQEAIAMAADVAEPGNVVLFSPGGTSFDQFSDFAERGERFRLWVQELS